MSVPNPTSASQGRTTFVNHLNRYPAILSWRCTRNITVSGTRKVLYPRLNRDSELPQHRTPGSFSNMRLMVRSLKPQSFASSGTE